MLILLLLDINKSSTAAVVIRTGSCTLSVAKSGSKSTTINFGYTYNDYPIVLISNYYHDYANVASVITSWNKSSFLWSVSANSEAGRTIGCVWYAIGI